MPVDAFREALPDAFAVVSSGWRYGRVLDEAVSLKAIFTVSGGWPPELDYGLCFERGIRVLSSAPAFAAAVAEMALGLALAAGRDIVGGDRVMRSREERWLSSADDLGTFLLYGKRVGLVGVGNIGRRLRALLEPFGCHVCAYDPWLTEVYLREERVEPVELDRLLETSRVIFVLAAPTIENKALLSRERLQLLAPDAVLVLVSRAHVVDFGALTELVLAGRPSAPRSTCSPLSRSIRIIRSRGARRCALAAPGRPRRGGTPRDRRARRRRFRGARAGPATPASPGGRARTRTAIRADDAGRREMTLAAQALAVLHENDEGEFVKPSQRLYPFQWNWDSAFVALGLAGVDPERGHTEVRSLLQGQWADGMVPHIVFHSESVDYRPGPELWQSWECEGAPAVPTSGLTQPPVLATAIRVLHEAAPDRSFLEEVLPAVEAWHAWFARERLVDGLVAVLHPWESADNAPRFDRALERLDIEGIDSPDRSDREQLDAAERPSDLEYRRYLALVAALRSCGYRPESPLDSPFAYRDLPLNSILAVAEEDLALLLDEIGGDGSRARRSAAALRSSLGSTWDEDAAAIASATFTTGRASRTRSQTSSSVCRRARRATGAPTRRRASPRADPLRAVARVAVERHDRGQVERRVRAAELLARAGLDQRQLVPRPGARAVRPRGRGGCPFGTRLSSSSRAPGSPSTTSRARGLRSGAGSSPGARPSRWTCCVTYDPEPRYPVFGGEVELGHEPLAAGGVARRAGRRSRRPCGDRVGARRRPARRAPQCRDARRPPLVRPMGRSQGGVRRPPTCRATRSSRGLRTARCAISSTRFRRVRGGGRRDARVRPRCGGSFPTTFSVCGRTEARVARGHPERNGRQPRAAGWRARERATAALRRLAAPSTGTSSPCAGDRPVPRGHGSPTAPFAGR